MDHLERLLKDHQVKTKNRKLSKGQCYADFLRKKKKKGKEG